MKQNQLLVLTSILSALLLALHISQDIVFGLDRAGLNHLVGVAILLVIVCGAVLLRDQAAELMDAGATPHRHALRARIRSNSGASMSTANGRDAGWRARS